MGSEMCIRDSGVGMELGCRLRFGTEIRVSNEKEWERTAKGVDRVQAGSRYRKDRVQAGSRYRKELRLCA